METHHFCTMIVAIDTTTLKSNGTQTQYTDKYNSYTMAVRDFADMQPSGFRCIYQQNHTTQSWCIYHSTHSPDR